MNLVIYHSPCSDGLASAWCFAHFGVDAEFVPFNYGKEPPENVEKFDNIFIVDFSFSSKIIEEMSRRVKKQVVVLDHHKTAFENLADLKNNEKLTLILDNDRAGCQITWDYLCPKFGYELRPVFLDYIADRDLWLWKLPFSKEINTALLHEKMITFEHFDELYLNWMDSFEILKQKGLQVLEFNNNVMNKIIQKSDFVELRDFKMLAINSTIFISELGNLGLEKFPINAVLIWRYNFQKEEFECSVRTNEHIDATKIAKLFGGGGHIRAAGFTVKNLLKEMKPFNPILLEKQLQHFIVSEDYAKSISEKAMKHELYATSFMISYFDTLSKLLAKNNLCLMIYHDTDEMILLDKNDKHYIEIQDKNKIQERLSNIGITQELPTCKETLTDWNKQKFRVMRVRIETNKNSEMWLDIGCTISEGSSYGPINYMCGGSKGNVEIETQGCDLYECYLNNIQCCKRFYPYSNLTN